MNKFSTIARGVFFAAGVSLLSAQESQEPAQNPQSAIQHWQDAKFGLFIHWGVYSVPAGVHEEREIPYSSEWIMRRASISKEDYRQYAAEFDPQDYDPAAWVSLAKEAGMKYIVITAKHHDGFALFDSKVSNWNAVKASGAKRDLLKPLVEECRRQNMPLGFHYSQAQDWWHPGGGMSVPNWDPSQKGAFDDYLAKVSVPQIQELLTNYGPVYSFFFDTPRSMNSLRAQKIKEVLPPHVLTNDRLYSGSRGDFASFERRLPREFFPGRRWEFCMTSNESWGYKASDTEWKSAHRLKRTLVETASRGGNFLLNVGPDSSGQFPEPFVERLKDVGQWTRANGSSIYGADRSPYSPIPWQGGCTMRSLPKEEETILYCHLFKHPKGGKLRLPGLTNPIKSVSIIGRPDEVTATQDSNSWVLTIPPFRAPQIPVVKIVLAGELVLEAPAKRSDQRGDIQLLATEAQLQGSDLRLERSAASLLQNIGSWKSPDSSVSWLIHLPKAGSYATSWSLACDDSSSGTEMIILAGDKELARFQVPATGGWGSFQKVTGPTVSLPAGTSRLRLVPAAKTGQEVVKLRSLSFTQS